MSKIKKPFMRTEVKYFNDLSKAYLNWYSTKPVRVILFRVRREKVLNMLPDGTNLHVPGSRMRPGIMIKGLRAKKLSRHRNRCQIEYGRNSRPREAGNDPQVTCSVETHTPFCL